MLPPYVDEEGVDSARRTETLAELVVEVNNWRWAGVPFRLRAGKAVRKLDKRVVITFKEPNWVPEGLLGYERPDRMHIGLDPEVLRFDFNVNGPADPRTVERVGMGVNLEPGDLPAYGAGARRGARWRFDALSAGRSGCGDLAESWNQCCRPGAAMPCRWRSTRPAATARQPCRGSDNQRTEGVVVVSSAPPQQVRS
jgi:hypothetical protein